MPTYTYRREDGSTFELEQRITEDALTTCPTTGQPVKRIITSGAGLVFKGSGFYLTDYSRGTSASSADTTPSSGEADKTAKPTADSPAEKSTSSESKGKDAPKPSSAGSSSD